MCASRQWLWPARPYSRSRLNPNSAACEFGGFKLLDRQRKQHGRRRSAFLTCPNGKRSNVASNGNLFVVVRDSDSSFWFIRATSARSSPRDPLESLAQAPSTRHVRHREFAPFAVRGHIYLAESSAELFCEVSVIVGVIGEVEAESRC